MYKAVSYWCSLAVSEAYRQQLENQLVFKKIKLRREFGNSLKFHQKDGRPLVERSVTQCQVLRKSELISVCVPIMDPLPPASNVSEFVKCWKRSLRLGVSAVGEASRH